MPRVYTKTKFNLGRDYHCGRCGRKIEPGERYFSWKFRYGGLQIRCAEHQPRESELTQSKYSTVLAAIEEAEEALESAESVEDLGTAIESVAQVANDVAQEYRDAAEAMGGAGGENEERADELESWASELESFDPDEPDEDPDSQHDRIEVEQAVRLLGEHGVEYDADTYSELNGLDRADVLENAGISLDELQEAVDAATDEEADEDPLAEAREEAQDLLNNRPF